MTHPSNAEEFDRLRYSEMCPWMLAYISLRAAILDRKNAAAPAKTLGGACTVQEAELARRLNVPLTSIMGLIQADHDRLYDIEERRGQAES